MAQGLADWELYGKGDHLPIAVKVALAMGPGAASSLVGGGCPALTVGDAEGAAPRCGLSPVRPFPDEALPPRPPRRAAPGGGALARCLGRVGWYGPNRHGGRACVAAAGCSLDPIDRRQVWQRRLCLGFDDQRAVAIKVPSRSKCLRDCRVGLVMAGPHGAPPQIRSCCAAAKPAGMTSA